MGDTIPPLHNHSRASSCARNKKERTIIFPQQAAAAAATAAAQAAAESDTMSTDREEAVYGAKLAEQVGMNVL